MDALQILDEALDLARLLVVGLELQHPLELGQRFRVLGLVEVHETGEVLRLGDIGMVGDQRLEDRRRTVHVAFVVGEDAEVHLGVGVEVDVLGQPSDIRIGFVLSFIGDEDRDDQLEGRAVVGIEGQGLLELGDARLMIALLNVGVFIDAEETWIQDALDRMTNQMMKRYNREKAIVYNTFQLYRHDRLAYLMESFNVAKREGYVFGAKLVRGAYMNKERARALEKGYPSPIQPTKAATDHDFDLAVRFCVENYEKMASCIATHNAESNRLSAELIVKKGIDKGHHHLLFSQLYGMSDHLTFNLAQAGFNVSKYLVYGQVRDVIPYLIRRSQENSSVTGDMSRELGFIMREMRRRKL